MFGWEGLVWLGFRCASDSVAGLLSYRLTYQCFYLERNGLFGVLRMLEHDGI